MTKSPSDEQCYIVYILLKKVYSVCGMEGEPRGEGKWGDGGREGGMWEEGRISMSVRR